MAEENSNLEIVHGLVRNAKSYELKARDAELKMREENVKRQETHDKDCTMCIRFIEWLKHVLHHIFFPLQQVSTVVVDSIKVMTTRLETNVIIEMELHPNARCFHVRTKLDIFTVWIMLFVFYKIMLAILGQ